jgi:hypothetical protein
MTDHTGTPGIERLNTVMVDAGDVGLAKKRELCPKVGDGLK